ncbi:hypothetical protein BDV06DRAFT_197010 [Aspergillus oleicola]
MRRRTPELLVVSLASFYARPCGLRTCGVQASQVPSKVLFLFTVQATSRCDSDALFCIPLGLYPLITSVRG